PRASARSCRRRWWCAGGRSGRRPGRRQPGVGSERPARTRLAWPRLMRGARRDQAVVALLDEVGPDLRMAREPRRRSLHGLLVLLVDEAIDRTLEPAQHRSPHVEALAEAETRPVRTLRLERDGAGEARAQHDVIVSLARPHGLHQLEGLAAPSAGKRINHPAQPSPAPTAPP